MGAFKEWRESNGANEKKKTTKATLNESGGGFSDWRKKRDEYTKLGFKSEVDYDRFKSFQDIYNNFSERYNSWGENTYKYLKHDVGEKEPSVILSRSNAIPGTIEAIKPNSYRAAIGAENAIARSDTSWNDDEMATDLQMRGKSLRREAGKILESMEQYKDVLSEESYKELSEYFKSISESDLDTIISAIDDELTFRSGYTNKEEYLNLKNRAERHSELDVSLPSKYGIDENTSLLEITALAEEA
ncbi:MAG: hypothetical protein IJD22_03160, partial [Clostridia bacterium]|nr:hypothetical protein [Clostridia bacterium]